jgi:hypothetical protein
MDKNNRAADIPGLGYIEGLAEPFTYDRDQIQVLLDKINAGYMLTQSEYETLVNITGFSGDYNDLINTPDIATMISTYISTNGIPNSTELDSRLSQLTITFNERCEDLNEEIRSHIDDEIAAVYEAIGEQPPGSVGGNLGDRVTVLEEANVQLESNLSWIMEQLEELPSYSAPTASLSISPNRTIHNESTRITITPSFSGRDGGDMISYTLRRGNDVLIESTSLQSYTDTVTLLHGGSNASYSMTVTYGDGPIKNTNTGRPYPETSIKAGSVSASASIRAYAYSYYGAINSAVVSEADIANLNRVILTSRSNTVTYDLQAQRSVFMYPSNYGTLSSIRDTNNFDYINSYNMTTMMFNGINYNVYVLQDPVEISGFRQIFT